MNYTAQWQRDGYLILRGVLDEDFVQELRSACDPPLKQWERESFPDGEPGRYSYGPTSWVMLHLNHPKYHRHHPERLATLLNAAADPRAIQVIQDIFREDAVMSQINYYINPSENRVGFWHRDCQFYPDVSEENEAQVIAREGDPPRDIHMHIPFVPSAVTEVVPGSHVRPDTAEEKRIRREDMYSESMPNVVRIRLEPGDLAFFHVNTVHRGLYEKDIPRRTVAVSFNRASDPRLPTLEMIKRIGYVSTYQPWFLKPDYLDGCLPAARDFYQRFIDVYQDSWGTEYLQPLRPSLREYYTNC